MSSRDASPATAVEEPDFQQAILVCTECETRKDGPEQLRSKFVRKALKSALRAHRPRPRILLTSCLGTCPKRALMVVAVGAEATPVGLRLHDAEDVEAAAALVDRADAPALAKKIWSG